MDLLGQRFGMLTVSSLATKSDQGKNGTGTKTTWYCECDCGGAHTVSTNNLRAGSVQSCGCLPTLGMTGDLNSQWTGGRSLKPNGYVVIRVYDYPGEAKGISVQEHTYVMAKHLGRALRKGESVHHLNGIRGDNRIENLELWSSQQPPGQRVADKVEFALDILRQYNPGLLKA